MVRKLDCGIGGMESHQRAFYTFFLAQSGRKRFLFKYVVERADYGFKVSWYTDGGKLLGTRSGQLTRLKEALTVSPNETLLFFFNDGWWIEQVGLLRGMFPDSKMLIRVGGNEIGLAPWSRGQLSYEERRRLWRRELNRMDYIIANSEYTVLALRQLNITHPRVVKIRGGVNERLCRTLREKKNLMKQDLRMRLGITKRIVLAFACRFVPFKGIIPALSSLSNTELFKDCFVILMGSGILQEEILTWCENHLDHTQFAYLGERPNEDVLKVLAAVDILLNPSLYLKTNSGDGVYFHTETMGRTMMESLTVGTKVFATDVGGTAELFDECQGAGVLVKPDCSSVQAGFERIEDSLQQPMTIVDYSWEAVFGHYIGLFVEP